MSSKGLDEPEFDFCLSFASEQRSYAENLAQYLKDGGARVFYDADELINIWGHDELDYFDEIYYGGARFCLILISAEYVSKMWTNHERQAAQAFAMEHKHEYVLPVRLDDTAIRGPIRRVSTLDGRTLSPRQIAAVMLEKLDRDRAVPTSGNKAQHPSTDSFHERASGAGLVNIENRGNPAHASPPAAPFVNAAHEVLFSAITGKYTFTRLEKEVRDALQRGVVIRAMLLDPKSEDMPSLRRHESLDLTKDIRNVSKIIRKVFLRHPLFEARYLSHPPPFTAIMTDERQRLPIKDRASTPTIRVQPASRYQAQHKGIVLVFERISVDSNGTNAQPFDFFAQDMREHWARATSLV